MRMEKKKGDSHQVIKQVHIVPVSIPTCQAM
jgi:hypothetical protein